jgi:enoyl-[acyl-carrier-protein] reductase (NADH)
MRSIAWAIALKLAAAQARPANTYQNERSPKLEGPHRGTARRGWTGDLTQDDQVARVLEGVKVSGLELSTDCIAWGSKFRLMN